jgi:hypothetical protein
MRRIEERWDADERKQQKYSLKNGERTAFINPIYFQLYISQN